MGLFRNANFERPLCYGFAVCFLVYWTLILHLKSLLGVPPEIGFPQPNSSWIQSFLRLSSVTTTKVSPIAVLESVEKRPPYG